MSEIETYSSFHVAHNSTTIAMIYKMAIKVNETHQLY